MNIEVVWRTEVNKSLAGFAGLATKSPDVDVTYGILATAVLWPIRELLRANDRDVINTVSQICGRDASLVQRAVQQWSEDKHQAAILLANRAAETVELRLALNALIDHFEAAQAFAGHLAMVIVQRFDQGDVYDFTERLKGALGDFGREKTVRSLLGDLVSDGVAPVRPHAEQVLLKLVREFWIDGVLDHVLDFPTSFSPPELEIGANQIQGFENVSILKGGDQSGQSTRDNELIIEQLTSEDQILLIIGEPGSGKTMRMLHLAKEALVLAENDPLAPLPLVFDLASWDGQYQDLAEWFVEELATKYLIARQTGKLFVDPLSESTRPLIFLDGLDEITPGLQAECVGAIDRFYQNNRLGSLIVCCSTDSFWALPARFTDVRVIHLMSLTPGQVAGFLETASPRLNNLKQALIESADLQIFARSPLGLAFLSRIFGDRPTDIIPFVVNESNTDLIDGVINSFVESILDECQDNVSYSAQDLKVGLSTLASSLRRQNKVIYQVESMQPDWLNSIFSRYIYLLSTRLLAGLLIGLGLLQLSLALFWSSYTVGVLYALIPGLLGGFIAALIDGISCALLGNRPKRKASFFSWYAVGRLILIGGFCGLAGGLIIGQDRLATGTSNVIPGTFLVGLPFGLLFGLRGTGQWQSDIRLAERRKWSWELAAKGLGVGLIGGLLVSVALDFLANELVTLVLGALNLRTARGELAIVLIPSIALLGAAIFGLQGRRLPEEVSANQGIRHSGQNALLAGGLFTLFVISASLLFLLYTLIGRFTVSESLAAGQLVAVTVGPLILVTALLWYGGLAWLEHYTLRLLFARECPIPWRIAPFLDQAVDLKLLHRVGGGYQFYHQVLRDYFAVGNPEQPLKPYRSSDLTTD